MKTKYLGKKTGSQTLDYSPDLLDSVHRSQNKKFHFYGVDYWNAYEFSFLDSSNQPVLESIEIKIPLDSSHTVESKSLKIYLASFYKRKFKNSINAYKLIERDLSNLINSHVVVRKKVKYDTPPKSILINGLSKTIKKNTVARYKGFRSICPVTSQPDWANIYLHSTTNSLDSKKFIRILKSFRERGDFHEACIDSIFITLIHDFKFVDLTICGRFLRRGGIDINPIRSTKKKIFFKNFRDFNQ